MATNITEVRLLAVPLSNEYINTFYFDSRTSQEEYFKSKTIHTMVNCTYVRKDNVIRFNKAYEDIEACNYVMYKNKNKWYYAFINKMEFISEGRTDLHIETDVLQTWLYNKDYSIPCVFVEREHVDDDTPGYHTVPEGLETGDYEIYNRIEDEQLKELVYIIQASEEPGGDNHTQWATNYGGVSGAGWAYVVPDTAGVYNLLSEYADNPDAIFGVYVVPAGIINWDGNRTWSGIRGDGTRVNGQSAPKSHNIELSDKQTLGNYKNIRNKKLLTFPYRYLLLSNNAGSSNVLHYENFKNGGTNYIYFKVEGVPCVGGSVKCIPRDYKWQDKDNQEEGLMLGKYPTTSWSGDMYSAWLSQNAVNVGVGIGASALTTIGGIASMFTPGGQIAGASMLAAGITGVASSLGQIYQQSFTPNSAQGNTNGGDYLACAKQNTFIIYEMGIKFEYANILDSYFDRYGYKVNIFKEPNYNHRRVYWYTKTIDCDVKNINSDIPCNDLKTINSCFNRGITFWKTPSAIGVYNVVNDIVKE